MQSRALLQMPPITFEKNLDARHQMPRKHHTDLQERECGRNGQQQYSYPEEDVYYDTQCWTFYVVYFPNVNQAEAPLVTRLQIRRCPSAQVR